jgi:nitroreductase/NAD-dependent dihydropyrimidine dehydrogenase PreA subunit
MKLQTVLDWLLGPGQSTAPKPVPVPPKLLEDRCNGCGTCSRECAAFVIEMREGKPFVARGMDCVECGHCIAVCPAGALYDPLAAKDDNRPYSFNELPSSHSLQLLFRARRSVRKYKDKPLPKTVLEKILDAGRYAPTGGNRPDVYYIVITSPEEIEWLRANVLESVLKMFRMLLRAAKPTVRIIGKETLEIFEYYIPLLEGFRDRWNKMGDDRIFYHAPAIMLVHGRKWDDIVAFGNAVALYQASLMAQTLKVGCCFNGFLQVAANYDRKIKRRLGIPRNHKCYGAMTLGYEKTQFRRLVRRRPPQVTWR